MKKPKLISLGFAVPERSWTQEKTFSILGYPRQFKRIFLDSGIEKRHFWIEPERMKQLSWQEMCEEFEKGSIELSTRAISNCLDGRDIKDIGCVTFASCTGYLCPSTVHRLNMGFRADTFFTAVVGQGCEGGGFPGLKRAYDFTLATGRPSIVVAAELCSCTYFPEGDSPDPENDYELLRGNAIFGDAASAALIGYDDDPRHPHIVDFEVYTNPAYLNDLGYVWRNGRLRLRLSKNVKKYAAEVSGEAVRRLLNRQFLRVSDINYWVIHAAGNRVLDLIRERLGIEEAKLYFSRKALRLYGNVSSATVGIIGKLLIQEADIKPGDLLVMVTIGPGISGGATICQFKD